MILVSTVNRHNKMIDSKNQIKMAACFQDGRQIGYLIYTVLTNPYDLTTNPPLFLYIWYQHIPGTYQINHIFNINVNDNLFPRWPPTITYRIVRVRGKPRKPFVCPCVSWLVWSKIALRAVYSSDRISGICYNGVTWAYHQNAALWPSTSSKLPPTPHASGREKGRKDLY
jgi:hypothetical protein